MEENWNASAPGGGFDRNICLLLLSWEPMALLQCPIFPTPRSHRHRRGRKHLAPHLSRTGRANLCMFWTWATGKSHLPGVAKPHWPSCKSPTCLQSLQLSRNPLSRTTSFRQRLGTKQPDMEFNTRDLETQIETLRWWHNLAHQSVNPKSCLSLFKKNNQKRPKQEKTRKKNHKQPNYSSPSAGMACGLLEQMYTPSPPVSKVPRKDLSS